VTTSVAIRIRGRVQGVGYRPFVWRLADRFKILGSVCNDSRGVSINATGALLSDFIEALRTSAPPMARVASIEVCDCEPITAENFQIIPSRSSDLDITVTPDLATCAECRAEIFNTQNFRYRYHATNCTNCGPRFSIINSAPYDRENTSMSKFTMCDLCSHQYSDVFDRRFHAQPLACEACGPKLWLEPAAMVDPILDAVNIIKRGGILGVKGVGGYHLLVDALDQAAIQRLRDFKKRPSKPMALMGKETDIRRYGLPSNGDLELLNDPAAPIVLIPRSDRGLAPNIAPNQFYLGWMLPYTALHHMLVEEFDGPLVVTSGNVSGFPQVISTDEARRVLVSLTDAVIHHDREIVRRLDDSVEINTPQGPLSFRRSRGRAPGEIWLPEGFEQSPQVLAFGCDTKNTITIVKSGKAYLSQYLGDLAKPSNRDNFDQAKTDYCSLFDVQPETVSCDLHPSFYTTAEAASSGLPLTQVQHHHAHFASCLIDNNIPLDDSMVAGVLLDGIGYGLDGEAWGGEIVYGNYSNFERFKRLRPAPLLGGDLAALQPWRNLLVRLDDSGLDSVADELLIDYPVQAVRQIRGHKEFAPMTSSVGRLFDAFAAALGICSGSQSFEAEAATRLESLARTCNLEPDPYPLGSDLDPTNLFKAWYEDRLNGETPSRMAWKFHAALALGFGQAVKEMKKSRDFDSVVLSGGCMQNTLLRSLLLSELSEFDILVHSSIPSNDAGISLGQAAVTCAKTVQGCEVAYKVF
jgi:hydrogenase maturation protein HypF